MIVFLSIFHPIRDEGDSTTDLNSGWFHPVVCRAANGLHRVRTPPISLFLYFTVFGVSSFLAYNLSSLSPSQIVPSIF
jgi:hypothetical protein